MKAWPDKFYLTIQLNLHTYNKASKIHYLLCYIEISPHQNLAFSMQGHSESSQFLVLWRCANCGRKHSSSIVLIGKIATTFICISLESSTSVTPRLKIHWEWKEPCCFQEPRQPPRHINSINHLFGCSGSHRSLLCQPAVSRDDGIIGSRFCCHDMWEKESSPMQTASVFHFFLEQNLFFSTTNDSGRAHEGT